MWEKALLLSIILLGLINRVKSKKIAQTCDLRSECKACQDFSDNENTKLRYLMYYLPVMYSGEKGQVCVCLKCEKPVRLTVTMEYRNQSIPIYNETTSNICGCKTFLVPTVGKEELAYISLSAVGNMVKRFDRKGVAINVMRPVCLTQTQKRMYQPGEEVECMVFCLDPNLKPVDQNFTKAAMMEPTGARLAEITRLTSRDGLCLVKFNTSKDATKGTYRIVFEKNPPDNPVTAYFSVEPYLPPRFESTLICPISLSVLERSSEVTVTSQYVYGDPVQGRVIGKCCRKVRYAYGTDANCLRGLEDLCKEFTAELNSTTGNHTEKLNLDVFKLQISQYDNSIQCEVTTKEAGTDVLVTKSCYIPITSQPANLQFDYNYDKQYYRPCLPYLIVAILTNEKGEAMANELINIQVDGEEVKNATTDAQGRISCEIDTTPYRRPNFTITVSYRNENQCYSTNQGVPTPWLYKRFPSSPYPYYPPYPTAQKIVFRMFSTSDSYLQMAPIPGRLACNKTHKIEVKYKVTEAGVGKGATEMTVHHMVRVRNYIVSQGQQKVTLTKCLRGNFYIQMHVTSKFPINPEIMVMAMMNDEIISDKSNFVVQSCFQNKASLAYTQPVVAPGSVAYLNLAAAPRSVCAIKTYDSSLDYIGAQSTMSADEIFYSLPNYYFGNYNFDDQPPPCVDPNKEVHCCGGYYRPVSSPTDGDTYSNFKEVGCVVTSNLNMRKQVVCGMEEVNYPIQYTTTFADGIAQRSLKSAAPESSAQSDSGGVLETKRRKFGDTYGYILATTGSDGSGTTKYKTMDTITTWNSQMICFSKREGVGLTTEPAEVKTLLSFFVEVTTAQYCIKGETIVIVGTAVNNLDKCIKVNLTIEGSDFKATPLDDDQKTCICKGQRMSRRWGVTFSKIGDISVTVAAATTLISNSCDGPNDESQRPRKDIVIKIITVEADGVKTEATFSYLINLNGSNVTYTVPVTMPSNVVPESCTLSYVIVGNMLGLGAENLDRLLRLPDGCCEQSMGAAITTVVLLNHLDAIGKLSDELKERAKIYLSRQYRRQLACRKYDGSFTIFPGTYVQNSWLDSRLLSFFHLLIPCVFVDPTIIPTILHRLSEQQDLETGCFPHKGHYFTAQDQDENNAKWHLTAFLAIQLIEIGTYSNGGPLLQGAFKCLQGANPSVMDIYTLAIVYRAAAVANLQMVHILHRLVLQAVVHKGGTAYWPVEKTPPALGQPCRSAEVDNTANILMGLLIGPEENRDPELIKKGVMYLCQCMNSKGGSSSSADSVSVMQVLTEYSNQMNTNTDTNCEVSLSQENKEVARIRANQANNMVVQKGELPAVYKPVVISASGVGSPLVQVTQKCNIMPNKNSSLTLNVTTRAKTCTEGVAPVIYMDICVRNNGKETTNMLLLELKPMTGYQHDGLLAEKMISPERIGLIQPDKNSLLIYLMPIKSQEGYCFNITTYMGPRCLAYKQNSANVQDYYYAGNSDSVMYSHPCSSIAKE